DEDLASPLRVGRGEGRRGGAAGKASPDDDDVVVLVLHGDRQDARVPPAAKKARKAWLVAHAAAAGSAPVACSNTSGCFARVSTRLRAARIVCTQSSPAASRPRIAAAVSTREPNEPSSR